MLMSYLPCCVVHSEDSNPNSTADSGCREQHRSTVRHAEHGGGAICASCADGAAPVCTEVRASLAAVVASLAARCAAMSSSVSRSSAEVAGRLTPNASCERRQNQIAYLNWSGDSLFMFNIVRLSFEVVGISTCCSATTDPTWQASFAPPTEVEGCAEEASSSML